MCRAPGASSQENAPTTGRMSERGPGPLFMFCWSWALFPETPDSSGTSTGPPVLVFYDKNRPRPPMAALGNVLTRDRRLSAGMGNVDLPRRCLTTLQFQGWARDAAPIPIGSRVLILDRPKSFPPVRLLPPSFSVNCYRTNNSLAVSFLRTTPALILLAVPIIVVSAGLKRMLLFYLSAKK